ncbi:MAG TPA: hypothetical protein VFA89_12705 [Terriglobales bacterium]|nr:hypothetical protein [Terriglobales bacterium]
MSSRSVRSFLIFVVLPLFCFLACIVPASAQRSPGIQARYEEQISLLTRAAGSIFRGTVSSVHAVRITHPGDVETVEITFRVEDGFRGVRKGQTVTLREWSGLWLQGQRYRVGERVLLFLYRPSKLGLSSAVGGRSGRFPIGDGDMVILPGIDADDPGIASDGPLLPNSPSHSTSRSSVGGRVAYRQFADMIRRVTEQ